MHYLLRIQTLANRLARQGEFWDCPLVSSAQDATTPVKKAQPDRTAPPLGMKAARASEDPSKQPPSAQP